MLGERRAREPQGAAWASRIVAAFPALEDAIAAADARQTDVEWRALVVRVFEANLGPLVLDELLRLGRDWPGEAAALVTVGSSAAHLGLRCGSAEAASFLRQWRQMAHHVPDVEGYCLAFNRLAEAAPDCAGLLAEHLAQLAAMLDGDRFFDWVHAGLRAHAHDPAARRAFFALKDDLARQLLAQQESDFSRLERRLRAGLAALWGEHRQLSALDEAGTVLPRRVSMAGGVLRFPPAWPGFSGGEADRIYRAACAHAGAHYHHSRRRFSVRTLKPVQVALVSLIEDARVEALAIRDYPGFAPLWRGFHTANPQSGATATALMARLARGLLDPFYVDDDGWVAKGRALFGGADLADQETSREIGGLLGGDLGQMRLQFNARTYVVEPAYRDDNLALWDFGDVPNAPQDVIALEVEKVGMQTTTGGGGGEKGQSGRAATMQPMEETAIASYPEWDHATSRERPDWVTVRHRPARAVPNTAGSEDGVAAKVLRITRAMPLGQRVRRKRLLEGEIIDLDAAISAQLARRMNQPPDVRIFQRSVPGRRDLAALLLLDLSQSTADRGEDGRSVLSLEREAAFAIGRAMDEAGDALAIDGFCSDGRANVHYTVLKEFGEAFNHRVAARLAGTESGYSTRLGAALRHAAARLEQVRAFRRVLLVLTDGEPSDIDVTDPLYLKEDARHAVLGLKHKGIDAFGFGIGSHASPALAGIFGHKRTLHVPRAATLPARLVRLYEELKK